MLNTAFATFHMKDASFKHFVLTLDLCTLAHCIEFVSPPVSAGTHKSAFQPKAMPGFSFSIKVTFQHIMSGRHFPPLPFFSPAAVTIDWYNLSLIILPLLFVCSLTPTLVSHTLQPGFLLFFLPVLLDFVPLSWPASLVVDPHLICHPVYSFWGGDFE